MAKIRLKDCPRCGGDCYFEDGIDGSEIVCFQCGNRRHNGPTPLAVSIAARRAERRSPPAAGKRRRGAAA